MSLFIRTIRRFDLSKKPIMDKEHIKGAADKVKGAMKIRAEGKPLGGEVTMLESVPVALEAPP